MRRSFRTAYSLTFLLLAAGGCRQTTGVNTAGPLTPIGPIAPGTPAQGSLTPLGTGQSPALGPFGGPTRVTPPRTGSYVAPNNYLGGTAANPGSTTYQSPAFAGGYGAQQNAPVGSGVRSPSAMQPGSGVQITGWNDANAANGVSQASENPFRANPSNPTTPRSGGMQVNDLTGGQPELRPAPVVPSQRTGNAPQWQSNIPSQNPPQWQSTQTVIAPQPAEIATRPSTESTNSLQWRRPGTR